MDIGTLTHREYTSLVDFVNTDQFKVTRESWGDDRETQSVDHSCVTIHVAGVEDGSVPKYIGVCLGFIYYKSPHSGSQERYMDPVTKDRLIPAQKNAACLRAITEWWIETHSKR
ncbi:hypothetical protein J4410_01785 [Candidatus Woesearchaeota archaeon]|nr:hypothetical protein [Candidatus Woesearchaeota archaeon]